MTVRIIVGDCRSELKKLPDDSIHCCVCSPPYWGLRDYGVSGQIGLEGDFRIYIDEMVAVFREVRRVLRADGTLWLNLGDSYSGGGRGGNPEESAHRKQATNTGSVTGITKQKWPLSGLKPKDLVGIPWRVAFALQEDGWYLRQDIIWSKPNPMPESVTDRCTKAHEYLFLLSKSERYWFDQAAIAEASLGAGEIPGGSIKVGLTPYPTTGKQNLDRAALVPVAETRNKRSVWTVASEPFNGARLMRDASGGSYRKVSPDCPVHGDQPTPASSAQRGEPRAASRSVRSPHNGSDLAPSLFDERAPIETRRGADSALGSSDLQAQQCFETAIPHSTETHKTGRALWTSLHETSAEGSACHIGGSEPQRETGATFGHILGSRTEVDCGLDGSPLDPEGRIVSGIARKCTCVEYSTVTDHFAVFPPALIKPCILAGCPKGGTVLDPFLGAGTTALVADRLGRHCVGIELNPEYAKMARKRIERDAGMFADVA